MGRYKALIDIVYGISDSFNSRNNDFQGYWALGVLYKFSGTNNINLLEFDILNRTMLPNIVDFYEILSKYSDLLKRLAEIKNINVDRIESASIKIYFNQHSKQHEEQIFPFGGDPYRIAVELIDKRGKKFESTRCGKCKYHDPNQEFKRLLLED